MIKHRNITITQVVAMVLSIIIVICAFPFAAYSEFENTQHYVETTVKIEPDEHFSIRIQLQNNTGITTAAVSLRYNKNALKLMSINYGGNFAEGQQPESLDQNIIKLIWSSDDTISGDVIYAVLDFVALSDCNENSSETIGILYDIDDFVDINANTVNIKVGVMECIPGDINCDGRVQMKDLRMLRNYFMEYQNKRIESIENGEANPDGLAMSYLNTLTDVVALDVNGDGKFKM